MNSAERRERRYERRKAKREAKRQATLKEYGDFDKVFTFDHLYRAFRNCCKGVNWKPATQRYRANVLVNLVTTLDQLRAGKYKSKGFYERDIVERGKPRHIRFVRFGERIVQRCVCDYSYIPIFSRTLVYDNGAGIKGKGVHFSVNRFAHHLREHYQKYGTEGYVLTYDFRKYFDSIPHERLKALVCRAYDGGAVGRLICQLIDDFGGDRGLGLGSQISQISAVSFLNVMDHYITERLCVGKSARHMDDGYLVSISKDFLLSCLERLTRLASALGLKLNESKTQVVKIKRGISFLKRRFILTDTGGVIVKPVKKGTTKMRHKLKTFRRWLDEGKKNFTFKDVETSFTSWLGHMEKCDAHETIVATKKFFNRLFEKEIMYAYGVQAA